MSLLGMFRLAQAAANSYHGRQVDKVIDSAGWDPQVANSVKWSWAVITETSQRQKKKHVRRMAKRLGVEEEKVIDLIMTSLRIAMNNERVAQALIPNDKDRARFIQDILGLHD